MEKNLYMIIINRTAHYFVYATFDEVIAWQAALDETGKTRHVEVISLKLSDFDEINHNHLC